MRRLTAGEGGVKIERDFSDLVGRAALAGRDIAVGVAVRERTIRLRRTGTADEMVTLIRSEGEQLVVLRDAVSGEPIEELFEGVVIGGELRLVVGLAGT